MANSGLMGVTNKILFTAFLWFALWTIGSNLIAIFELGSDLLIVNLLLSVMGAIFFSVRTTLNFSEFLPSTYTENISFPYSQKAFLAKVTTLVVLALLTGLFVYKYHFSWAYFIGGSAVLALGYFWSVRLAVLDQPYHEKTSSNALAIEVMFFILLTCVLYYFGHQVDIDDANYVNLGLGAFRTEGGVFEYDTMIGDGGLPIHLPTYKAHSFELLVGTLAFLLPGSALLYMHVVVPIFFCILFALTLFLINYNLFKQYWVVASVFQLVFTMLCIDALPSLGAHGFFRFFQGKIEFIHIVIPLSILQVIKWNAYGKNEDLLFLFVLMVSSVGLTANAIYLAPIALGIAAVPFLFLKPINKDNLVRFSLTFSPVLYPVVIAVLIIAINGIYPSEITEKVGQLESLFTYFGWGLFGIACVAFMPISAFFMFEKKRAHYLYLYMGAIFFFFFNPLFWPIISSISGNLPGRVFWTVPFPILFSIPFIAILKVYVERLLHFNVTYLKYLSLVGLFLIAILGLNYHALDVDRQVKIDWHTKPYRVDYSDFEVAQIVAKKLSPDCTVLLPKKIARNITMIESHPFPVAVRNLYLEHYRHTMDKNEIQLRWELMNSVSKKDTYAIDYEDVKQGFEKFDVDALLIRSKNINFEIYQHAITNFKLNHEMTLGEYNLYYKDCR